MPQSAQDEAVADWELRKRDQAETCSRCGYKVEECSDPDHEWFPVREIDYAEMAKAYAEYKYAALHKQAPYHDGSFQSWSKNQNDDHPFHYSTGVHVWVSKTDERPDDRFLDDPQAMPARMKEAVARGRQDSNL